MPYYHIDITDSENQQFVVNATDRKSAELIAMTAAATGKCDNKKIVKLPANRSSAISVSETDKSAWLDTLKRQKVNK
jgi:hypothetical protein